MISKKVLAKTTTRTYTQKITSSVFKKNLLDCIIGSSLILTGLLKIAIQERQIFIRVYLDHMYQVKMINNSWYFLFQLSIQKTYMMCNIYFMLPMLCFNKKRRNFYLEAFLIYLSTLWYMLIQELFQVKLNSCYIFKNMNTKAELNLQLQLWLTNKGT